jgi:hypothetical protein
MCFCLPFSGNRPCYAQHPVGQGPRGRGVGPGQIGCQHVCTTITLLPVRSVYHPARLSAGRGLRLSANVAGRVFNSYPGDWYHVPVSGQLAEKLTS